MRAQTTANLAGTVSDGAGPLSVTVGGQPFAPTRQTGPSPDTWTVDAADVQPGPNAVEATADGVTAQQTLNMDVAGVGDYEYDANGNRVRYTDAFGAVTAYAYDRENRLVRIDYADGTASAFEYDGLGRRVATIEYDAQGGVTDEKRFLYDGLDLVEIRDAGGATLGQVVHGPGIDNPLALVQFDGLGAETARYFYHTDHLGSVRLLTNSSGGVARTYDYSAYGVRLDDPGSETTLNPFTYTGREYHAPSGLYFYRARWYDPAVGHFVSVDPIGITGGVNVYAYAQSNPGTFLDPLGLYTVGYSDDGVHTNLILDQNDDGYGDTYSYANGRYLRRRAEERDRTQETPNANASGERVSSSGGSGNFRVTDVWGPGNLDVTRNQDYRRQPGLVTRKVSEEEFRRIQTFAETLNEGQYNAFTNSCRTFVRRAIRRSEDPDLPVPPWLPHGSD